MSAEITRISLKDRLDHAAHQLRMTGFHLGADNVWHCGKKIAHIVQKDAEGVPEYMRHPTTGEMVKTPPAFFESKVTIEYDEEAAYDRC